MTCPQHMIAGGIWYTSYCYFLKDLFLERRGGRQKERERNIDLLPLCEYRP